MMRILNHLKKADLQQTNKSFNFYHKTQKISENKLIIKSKKLSF